VEPDLFDPVPVAPPSRRRRVVLGAIAAVLVAGLVLTAWPSSPGGPMPSAAAAGGGDRVTILVGTPASIDPAKHGDLGSAAYVSQLYETLTAVDPSLAIQPALAESWTIADDGRRVTFTLRPGLTFSDGTPLTADDVVRSWRRLFIPGDPSPLASLAADVTGARDLLTGASTDTASLGVRAEGDRTVVVDMEHGGGDLPAIVSGAPFAVVPPGVGDAEIIPDPGRMVVSGAYTLDRVDPDRFVLKANPRYWQGSRPSAPSTW
jgi:oligopeptide transport system substrate-binding protein